VTAPTTVPRRPEDGRSTHADLLRAHVPPAALAGLAAYLDLLAEWSRRTNLTGAATPEARSDLLVGRVAPLAPHLLPGGLLDIGSGNGSPGLVLGLLRPDLKTTLLEPRMRRWAFLREAARRAGRTDIQVLRARHDQYTGEPATNATLRAVRLPLAELRALVVPEGRLWVLGEPTGDAEGWREEFLDWPAATRVRVFRRGRST
jgi:16S rRNA (guanine527-N7)-methyltransferase